MGVFNNFTHLLQLSFVFVVIVIPTSWSAAVNHGDSTSSEYYRQPKQFDERISNLIAENVLNFAHNMGLELAALDPHAEQSQIFSPLSIMTTLSFLLLGAKGNSYNELKQLLGLNSDSELKQNPSKYHEEYGMMLNDLENSNVNHDGNYKRPIAKWRFTTSRRPSIRTDGNQPKAIIPHTIRVANGLFLQSNTLNPDYRQVVESIYKSAIIPLDFQNHSSEARDYINEWVSKATFGKIPNIISDLDPTTKIVIASALYFRAFWETSFIGKPFDLDFYPDGPGGPSTKVKMMVNTGIFPYYYAKEHDCSIIGLPYNGNDTTMYVILPNHSTRQRLRELQHVLNGRKINEMIDKMERKTVTLTFPKMHFTRTLDMIDILRNMNVSDIFINGLSALSLIGNGPPTRYASLPVPGPISTPSPVPALSPLPARSPLPALSRLPVQSSFPLPVYKRPVSFGEIYRIPPASQIEVSDRLNEQSSLIAEKFGGFTSFINRTKRDVADLDKDTVKNALLNLETDRSKIDSHPADYFVNQILHKVDFSVDEQGTEAAAATVATLKKSGTELLLVFDTPFLIFIRHDPTKLPLFYGIINKPEL